MEGLLRLRTLGLQYVHVLEATNFLSVTELEICPLLRNNFPQNIDVCEIFGFHGCDYE
jgi:hypothetical protein